VRRLVEREGAGSSCYGASVRVARGWGGLAAGGALLFSPGACGGPPPAVPEEATPPTNVEVATLEIDASGIDRFATCPPPGELGQAWIPPIPSWSASGSTRPADPDATPLSAEAASQPAGARAFSLTHEPFRTCYARGLNLDPTQDGHVAIVLRVGADGRVAKVESYGACEIARDTIQCMHDAAKQVRLAPPQAGSDTVVLPAVFEQTGAPRPSSPSSNDAYTTLAFVAVESLRPAFHSCEESVRREGQAARAKATFALDLDARGRVLHANVAPWEGNQRLLACTATALEHLVFPPPPGGRGSVRARIAFNPGMVAR